LQKRIVARELELGMRPILHGFNGHVPQALTKRFPKVKMQQIHWYGPTPVTYCLSPEEPLFVEIGKAITAEQIIEFGTTHFYGIDSFIEMLPPSSDPTYLAAIAKASYESLHAADPEAVWVLQGWMVQSPARQKFWQPAQAHAFFGAVPDDKMLVLDMSRGVFARQRQFYYGKPWLVGLVHNFGDATRMYGEIAGTTGILQSVLRGPDHGQLRGIGLHPEGLDYNPIVHAAILEAAWNTESPNAADWLADYVHARYGSQPPEQLLRAWRGLWSSVYSKGLSNSPIENAPDRWLTRKAGADNQAETDQAARFNTATLTALAGALPDFLAAAPAIKNRESFDFDVVNITRQLLAEYAGVLRQRMLTAVAKRDVAAFRKSASEFIALIGDLEDVVSTRREYLLGRWLAAARSWGTTAEEKSLYEWNARNIITLWGNSQRNIRDYARRQWSGLLGDFYQPRWQLSVDYVAARLEAGQNPDFVALKKQLVPWEEQWCRKTKAYPTEPRGNSVEVAGRVWEKYRKVLPH
jgi:alpha-N-acetylglucosaminidase